MSNTSTKPSYYASSNASIATPSTNGVHSPAHIDAQIYHEQQAAQPRSGANYADYAVMPPVRSYAPRERPAAQQQSYAPITPAESQTSRPKRKRDEGPDWNAFYGNGLPKEVIVIDDSSPEPERSTKPVVKDLSSSRILPPPIPSHPSMNRTQVMDYDTVSRHIAKKRRREEEPTYYDPIYHNTYAGSHTPHHNAASAKSTISSDRTTSAVHTTAATSLESLSSSTSAAHEQYNANVNAGQKRKRTTRQQVAQETRRRQEEQGDACVSYRPLTGPPKKVADVQVKVIADLTYAKASEYDDQDGHYIVVPGQELANRCTFTVLMLHPQTQITNKRQQIKSSASWVKAPLAKWSKRMTPRDPDEKSPSRSFDQCKSIAMPARSSYVFLLRSRPTIRPTGTDASTSMNALTTADISV